MPDKILISDKGWFYGHLLRVSPPDDVEQQLHATNIYLFVWCRHWEPILFLNNVPSFFLMGICNKIVLFRKGGLNSLRAQSK